MKISKLLKYGLVFTLLLSACGTTVNKKEIVAKTLEALDNQKNAHIVIENTQKSSLDTKVFTTKSDLKIIFDPIQVDADVHNDSINNASHSLKLYISKAGNAYANPNGVWETTPQNKAAIQKVIGMYFSLASFHMPKHYSDDVKVSESGNQLIINLEKVNVPFKELYEENKIYMADKAFMDETELQKTSIEKLTVKLTVDKANYKMIKAESEVVIVTTSSSEKVTFKSNFDYKAIDTINEITIPSEVTKGQ